MKNGNGVMATSGLLYEPLGHEPQSGELFRIWGGPGTKCLSCNSTMVVIAEAAATYAGREKHSGQMQHAFNINDANFCGNCGKRIVKYVDPKVRFVKIQGERNNNAQS